jgi:hypothetical protein
MRYFIICLIIAGSLCHLGCVRCKSCKATYVNGGGQNVIDPVFEFCGQALKNVENGQVVKEVIDGDTTDVRYDCN